MLTESDERYMKRALELARRVPFTAPNPKVGAVVVRDDRIVGEGWHQGAGHPHAESMALQGVDGRGATLYVTLEPCVHHGRTPPCAERIVTSGIARVVVAMEDPDDRMRGAGLRYLRDQGVDVTSGLLEGAAQEVNTAFVHQRRTGRPLFTLKLALSIDGRLAAGDGNSRWITGEPARQRAHERRAEVDAILVGAGTVLADDPRLTARVGVAERQPTRVVLDSSGRIPPDSAIFNAGHVIVASTSDAPHDRHTAWKERGAEVVVLPGGTSGIDLQALVTDLNRRGWLEILCEGGASLATSLLRDDIPDRLEIYTGPALIGGPGIDVGDLGVSTIAQARRMKLVDVTRLGEDVLTVYERGGA